MRMKAKREGPYRSRRGLILGVCRGLAEYFHVSVFWTRVVAVALFFVTTGWPVVGLYLLAGILMKPEPVRPLVTEADREFYSSYTSSRRMALQRLKRTFDRLDRRVQRMEHVVTGREYDWERRLGES